MTKKRERRTFNENFKQQIVQLYKSGKTRAEILREYDLFGPTFDRWVKLINSAGTSYEKDNLTPEKEELIRLKNENKQLKMEKDIFKTGSADIRTKVYVMLENTYKCGEYNEEPHKYLVTVDVTIPKRP